MPTAYSYVRFSQLSQARGGSLERQTTTAQEYCEQEGLTLDNRAYKDLGVSGFKGKNAKEGALNEFMEAVEAKKIAPGSLLLIEDMDRLTRLPVLEGLAVFQRILAGGITLVTLKNGNKYSTESLNKDWTQLMPVLFDMSRGWGESARKSDLLGKAWHKKKEQAVNLKPMGDNAPMWLEYAEDEETGAWGYREVAGRKAVVNRIFQLSIDGYGHGAITAILNKDGVKPFRRPGKDTEQNKRSTWGTTSVSRLLGNRAVLGEYQPWTTRTDLLKRKPDGTLEKRSKAGPAVPGYFPQIVTPELFNRAQDAVEGRHINRTKKQSKAFNVWHGVSVCAGCGASMTTNNKGKSRLEPKVDLTYLICSNSQKGLCEETGVRLDASEIVFRDILAVTGNMSLIETEVAQQENQLQAARGRLTAEQGKLDRFVEDYRDTRSRSILALMTEQEQVVSGLEAEIVRLEELLAANSVIDREGFFKRIDLVTREGRNKANALMKRLGIKVAIKKAGRRSKTAYYSVYQNEERILTITDDAGKLDITSDSPDISWRLLHQGQLKQHEMEINVGFRSKRLPKPLKVEDTKSDS
jgi:hypothetical protein